MNALVLGLTCLFAAPPAHDATRRVHDFADVLPPDVEQTLEQAARDVERQTTAQLAVVTLISLDGETVEAYANKLFNSWGIGRADVNNGVLLLVVPHDRRMRIEVGRGLEPLLTDALCGEIRDDFILPAFRSGDLVGGIRSGTERLAEVLRKYPEAARGVPGSAPLLVRTARRDALSAVGTLAVCVLAVFVVGRIAVSRRSFSTPAFYLLCAVPIVLGAIAVRLSLRAPRPVEPLAWLGGTGAAAVGAMGVNFRRYRRYGPRSCAKCGTRLELLDEAADDVKLSEVQRLEERLGSINYDVWYCPACLHDETEAYVAFFSTFGECPQCRARAFKEGPRQVIQAATAFSTGFARIDGACQGCNHQASRTVILPKIAAGGSSSSGSSFSGGGGGGGSSFGGGSSGGGGASGSW